MKAYITLSHGDALLGTLRLTLRPDVVPRTVENFVHFLTAATTTTTTTTGGGGVGVGYRDSTFHRIIPKFMAQGGDFVNGDGTGSRTIFDGHTSFPDENFILSHSQRGTLSMANTGPDTNGCQFFVTFGAAAHLDGRHVVFGSVDWREDVESADALDGLERVGTDRRNGRPLEAVRIVDCGVVGGGRGGEGRRGGAGEGGGIKLVGEAKKNKLMQAYGDVDPAAEAATAAAEGDEIDIDDEDDEMDSRDDEDRDDNASYKIASDANKPDSDEIDIDGEIGEQMADDIDHEDTSGSTTSGHGKMSKKAALQKRLVALRAKINQSRTLNRREVHTEATRMGTDEAAMQERKRQNKQDRNARQKEYDTYVVGKLREVAEDDLGASGPSDVKAEQKRLASLFQPAYDSIRQMNARADKKERSLHGPDDYYNPEGQYSNYERNLNSVRHAGSRRGDASAAPGPLDSYDPTLTGYPGGDTSKQSSITEKEGAKRLAMEMKRRAEKKANQKRKLEFDAVDVTSINDRNKRFNQKIGRNFDKHTAEIRQNLERGTAL
ncbi:hypothetical protein ACHAW5_007517 [Stephanodiscus triporus]|uniref:peptidylprolyl isomerase n=1 Tax=Stephanodiscus triporus TaxID=2934178 RepID=A0ABD3N524_9STRA